MTLASKPNTTSRRRQPARPPRTGSSSSSTIDRTLAVVPSWIEAHCVVPDGFRRGEPFTLYDWQLRWYANFYLVRGDATWTPRQPATSRTRPVVRKTCDSTVVSRRVFSNTASGWKAAKKRRTTMS